MDERTDARTRRVDGGDFFFFFSGIGSTVGWMGQWFIDDRIANGRTAGWRFTQGWLLFLLGYDLFPIIILCLSPTYKIPLATFSGLNSICAFPSPSRSKYLLKWLLVIKMHGKTYRNTEECIERKEIMDEMSRSVRMEAREAQDTSGTLSSLLLVFSSSPRFSQSQSTIYMTY